ncbi:hypothetical protein lerEdw1_004486 [Lerista edwardsae]|nr:hypothetical protein lerEdw1_004486 [Lerista edwardsae]
MSTWRSTASPGNSLGSTSAARPTMSRLQWCGE